MLWLYDKTNDNTYNFFQVFIDFDLLYNDDENNMIYSFDTVSPTEIDINSSKYQVDSINCDVRMIDNMISYDILHNDSNNKMNTKKYIFTYKNEFIKPSDNQLLKPIFNYIYKSINIKKFPNLIESKYDLSLKLNFVIHKLDNENKIIYVYETNLLTNAIRKYFVTTDTNLIQKYLKK